MEGAGDVMQEERRLRRVIRGAAPSLCRPLGSPTTTSLAAREVGVYGVWVGAPAAREVGVIGVWVARIAGGMEGACKDEERRTGRGGAAVGERAIGERTLVGSGESEGVEGGTADVAGGAGREMARCRFAVRVVDEV